MPTKKMKTFRDVADERMADNDGSSFVRKYSSKPKKEVKERYNIMLKPGLYREIKELAYEQRKSASELIGDALELYLSDK